MKKNVLAILFCIAILAYIAFLAYALYNYLAVTIGIYACLFLFIIYQINKAPLIKDY